MKNEIKLLKNNDNRELSDLEWVEELFEFLQGDVPEEKTLAPGHRVKLTADQAYSIIWFLQERFPLLPDQIEKCDTCDNLYDSYSQGHHSELTGKFYCCMTCEPADLYEREHRAEKRKAKQLKNK